MSRIPAFLLRHRATIERATPTWGVFGTGETIRCFVGESLASPDGTGTRVARISVYAAPGTALPAGSRVTLADGRRGYITASVNADGGGLPTPDHVEAAVEIATVAGPAYGETVVILRRTVVGRDRYNADRYATSEVAVHAAVHPQSTDERLGEQRDRVTTVLEVILPPGTTIAATDRLRIRGLVYEVDGQPDERYSPDLGVEPGVRIIARRITG